MSNDVNATPPPQQTNEFEFFPTQHWVSFCESALVHARMAGLDVAYGIAGQLETPDGASYGLLPLAQRCVTLDPSNWDDTIAEYFDQITSVVGNDDFGVEVLRVRLFPDGVVPPSALEQPQWRRLTDGVLAALVAAMPTALRTLNPTDLLRLDLDEDTAWKLAWHNVQADASIVERHEAQTIGQATVQSLFGRSYFVASKVGVLEATVGEIGPHGALVAVPRRHSLAVHKIVDLSVVDAINGLLPFASKVAEQGPGPITDQLMWWRDGTLIPLASAKDGEKISFTPPVEFVEMLNSLKPAPQA